MVLDTLRSWIPIKRARPPVVAVLRLHGVIGPQQGPLRPSLNLAALAGAIEHAFKLKGIKAVALSINSPGGAPVQSALIHDRIRALAAEKKLPVYAFCEDVAASGGYWIACAGDEIHANATSIVGSIGVISAGFGFTEMIEKIGVKRRLYTAGEKKSLLDPFLPENPEDVARLKTIQAELHEAFKAHVRRRREGRLKDDENRLFNGDFWTGEKALELGLIDGVGDLRTVMRERYGDKVRLRVVQAGRSWLQRRLGIGAAPSWDEGFAGDFAHGLFAAAETRTLWSRFGL